MKTRKPNWKDKMKDCWGFLKEIVISVVELDLDRVQFYHLLFWETVKGNFRVVEDEKDESTNC